MHWYEINFIGDQLPSASYIVPFDEANNTVENETSLGDMEPTTFDLIEESRDRSTPRQSCLLPLHH